MTHRTWLLAALLAGVLSATASCGIPAENEARPVDAPPGPYGALTATQAPTSEPRGAEKETLCLVKDGALHPTERPLTVPRNLDDLMEDLLSGPTEDEHAAGLSSSLSKPSFIGDVRLADGLAIVDVEPGPDGNTRSDEVMAFAQVVCTLDTRQDVTGVAFTQGGHPIAVPRGDGALSEGPLTTGDYAPLLGPR
jgi:hypothetical protein